jgi:hypothetical protein
MKIVFILCIALFVSFSSFCQDILIHRNGEEIKAKVIEITPTEIAYKKFDNISGPTYKIFKSEVFMIKYESGEKEVFEEVAIPTPQITNQIASPPLEIMVIEDQGFTFGPSQVQMFRTYKPKIRMSNKVLNHKQLLEYFSYAGNKECLKIYKDGYNDLAKCSKGKVLGILLFSSGAFVGLSGIIETETTDQEALVKVAGLGVAMVGAGLVIYSKVLNSRGCSKYKQAVTLYNAAF